MPGHKTIYSRDGSPLTDIRASVVRSCLLNDIGEATFMIDTAGVKCRREYLEFGNLILVQHDTLPDWVGVIDTPRIWHHGYVEVHAYELPYLLQYRYPPLNVSIEGTPGSRFQQLLVYANTQGETLVRSGTVSENGASFAEVVSDSVYSHIKKLAADNGFDWVCTPRVDPGGQLTIIMDWLDQAGVVTDLELSQGKNILYGDTPLEESGELISFAEAVSDIQETGILTSSYGEDMPYGLRAERFVSTGTADASALLYYATERVTQKKTATLSTPLTIVDDGNTFQNIRLGNIVQYKYTNVGFGESGLGLSQFVRVEGFRFNESVGTCELFVGKVP